MIEGTMMNQKRITIKDTLLDESGHLKHPGYATSLVLEYHRNQVKAHKSRIKEWDYYFFGNDQIGFGITFADISYLGLIQIVILDFANKKRFDFKRIIPFTFGKLNLPTDSQKGDIHYHDKKIGFDVKRINNERHIKIKIKNFNKGRDFAFVANVRLQNEDSLVIITPYAEDKKAFYYNQKINNLVSFGRASFGNQTYSLDDMQGVLDWGRGVWTRDNTWYWSSLSTTLSDGSLFGFNLGYGFGDTSAASENMAFYKGKSYKLNDVDFGLPKDNFTDPWHFTSKDGAINLIFTPIYDNFNKTNVIFIRQNSHQVFGYFSGTMKLDSDTTVTLERGFGFAEKVRNVW